ncbi:putative disease resistance RPP13-like protein 1 [Cinnamomum micranthum f. kanehirae]|uniref:Putative disease resistance RPP13-like protein 1 n=1 Tax=Cinnamomum micranthum f. kanehirae TaxID=337451 RepID=A0A3S3NC92_9MAGN|nr:putative disease resistance RPP13-like protein 1 [Cinnamomum micranthum f. kanehirae]
MNENEATEVKLHEKIFLHSLSLHCEDKETLGDDEMKKMEGVFQGLRPPHSNLRDLKICNYAGSKFPTWLEDSAFSNLVKVELRGCKKCELLPGLGNLHSLEFLKIYAADAVKEVGSEFYGDGYDNVCFRNLEQLCFDSMLSWEKWELTEGHGDVMPSLKKLKIVRCHKLKALPDLLPNKLEEVVIEQCEEIVWMARNPLLRLEDLRLSGNRRGIFSNSLPDLPALKILDSIESSDKSLPSDGWGLLESLHTLNISYCPRLASLPDGLEQLKALRTLAILGCYQLLSLPEGLGQLEALQTIKIRHCYGLTSLLNGSGRFKALQNICIIRCTKLKSLSDGLVQLEALETVCVHDCTELQSLFGGFEQLKSLRSLDICDCPKLKPLSNLQHLTTLEELKIACCPVVTEQLEKEIEEDWRNLSHITRIVIDFQRIQ